MTMPISTIDELTMGKGARLDELVDRTALAELARNFCELHGVAIRIFDIQGRLLAEGGREVALLEYLRTLRISRNELERSTLAVKALEPGASGEGEALDATGGRFAVFAIENDTRRVGRVVIGPYFTPELQALPASLCEADGELDVPHASQLLGAATRMTRGDALRFGRYFVKTLDLILFSGYRALLTSNMHLASVRENYRDLEDKNAKLQVAYDRLKELDRLKSNFLATVSHELRTPLTSIIGYSEMLAEGIAGDLTEEQRDFVQTIREKGEQLLQLIKGLLDLSKLESGTMSMRKQPVRVPALLDDVIQTMTPSAKKKGIGLGLDVDRGMPELHGDVERLRQVLLNLLENALKFTPNGGVVSLTSRMTTMESNSGGEGGLVLLAARRPAIELRVADTGIGIPPAERERVFDAFYQVDSSSTREQGGTGLGLSIVKRLVDSHDGVVRIEDNQPRGTAFVITIPIKRASIAP
jgi:two-component system, NarL family, sensor histidine kinase BarA